MERSGSVSIPLPLLLLGLFGVGAFTTVSSRSSPAASQPSEAVPAVAPGQGPGGEPEGDWLVGARPALELLADHLDVPREHVNLNESALLASRIIEANAGGVDAVRQRQLAALGCTSRAEAGPRCDLLQRPDESGEQLAAISAGEIKGAADAPRQALVQHLLSVRQGRALLKSVKDHLACPPGADAARCLTLDALVATLPDYVDSYSAWLFDRNLDGIQRAAGAASYALDRFYLPDWDPNARSTEPKGERHVVEPGAILYRGTGPYSNRLLLVMVPVETATAGVSKRAMLSALALAHELTPYSSAVRIVGPSFSGSVRSVRIVLEEALRTGLVPATGCEGTDGSAGRAAGPCIVVRSGSATDGGNKETLEREYCGVPGADGCVKPVAFQATTVTNDDMQEAMAAYLGSIDEGWRTGERVAILTEATTSFGLDLSERRPSPRSLPVDGQKGLRPPGRSDAGQVLFANPTPATSATPDGKRGDEGQPRPFDKALRLTYPLHISRLRTEARAGAVSGTGGRPAPGPTTVALRLEDASTPTDQLPAVRPQATAAVVQTTLENIVDALERARVTAVGLYGTDDRDKIYLAEQLRYRAPNVLLFTIEGGLVVLHPQARAFMTGMLVAGPYPSHSATQLLGDEAPPTMHQFQAIGAEGTYNAFLSQLIEREASVGNVKGSEDLRNRLADYALAGCRDGTGGAPPCGPGVWISVVGRNAIWPVRRYALPDLWEAQDAWKQGEERQETAARDYTWGALDSPPQARESRRQPSSPQLLPVAHAAGQAASGAGMASASSSTARAGGRPTGQPGWSAFAQIAFAIVGAAVAVHVLGLVAIASILMAERRPRRKAGERDERHPAEPVVVGGEAEDRTASSRATAVQRLAARLRRHVPWLEPPDLCSSRWAPPPRDEAGKAREERERRETALRQEYWLSLLACVGGVTGTLYWTSHMAVIGLSLHEQGRELFAALGIARLIAWLACFVACVLVLFPTARRRKARLTTLAALRVVPIGLGLLVLWKIHRFLGDSQVWGWPWGAFNVMRLAEVKSMVSPTVPVVAFALAVYLWGLWNLWRLHHQAVAFGPQAAVAGVLRRSYVAPAVGEPAVVKRTGFLLDAPPLAVGLVAGVVLTGVLGLELWTGRTLGTSTVDGASMNSVLLYGTMLVSFLVGHTLAYGLRQALSLLHLLEALSLAPIGAVFEKLGKRRELWQLSAGTPRAAEAHLLMQQARATAYALSSALDAVPALEAARVETPPGPDRQPQPRRPDPAVPPDVDERSRGMAVELRVRPGDVVLMQTVPVAQALPTRDEDERQPLHASPAWAAIQEWSIHLVRVLWRGPWDRRGLVPVGPAAPPPGRTPVPNAGEVVAVNLVRPSGAESRDAYFAAAETLLGLQVAFTLRYSVTRLMSVFGLTVSALLLLLWAHLFYTFQSRAFWLGIDWVLIGVATAIAVYFFVRLEKSAVLSHLWQSEPGKINWGDQLFKRILLYGAIPVITLFMTFFPEVGGFLFSWLEPVQKSLP